MTSTTNINTANVSINGLSERSGQNYYQRRNIALPVELEELSHECQDRVADVMPPLAFALTGQTVNDLFKPLAFLENDDRDTNKHSNESDNESHCTFGNPNADLILSQEGGFSPKSLPTPLKVFEPSQISPSEHLTDNQQISETNKTSFITEGSNKHFGLEEPNGTFDHNELDEAMAMFRDIQSKLKPHIYEQALKKLACQQEFENHTGCFDNTHEELIKANEKLKCDYLELLNTLVTQKKQHAEAIVDLQEKFAKLNEEYSQLKQKEDSISKFGEKSISIEKSGISNVQTEKSCSKKQIGTDELAGETIEEIDLTCQRDNTDFSRNNITCVGPTNETPRSVSDNFDSLRFVLAEGNQVYKPKKFEFPKPVELNQCKPNKEGRNERVNNEPKLLEKQEAIEQEVIPAQVHHTQALPSEYVKHQPFNPNINQLLSPISTPRTTNLPETFSGNIVCYQPPRQQSDLHSVRSITHYVASKDSLNCTAQNVTQIQPQNDSSFSSSQNSTNQHRGKVIRISISDYSSSAKNFSSQNPRTSQMASTQVTSHPVNISTTIPHPQPYVVHSQNQVTQAPAQFFSGINAGEYQHINNVYANTQTMDKPSWRQRNLFLESERNLEPLSPQNVMTFLPRGTFGRQGSPSFSPHRFVVQGSPNTHQMNSVRFAEDRTTNVKEQQSEGRKGDVQRVVSIGANGNGYKVSNNGYEDKNGKVFRITNN